MLGSKPHIFASVALIAALTAALAFESVYDVSVGTRASEPFLSRTHPIEVATRRQPLTLRLVDSGGVGIPVSGEWGADYSHDRRTFRDVIREAEPYVDAAAVRRVELEWRSYVERMVEYGNNAIAVPLLLELIDFDRVNLGTGSTPAGAIYAPDDPFRARHAAVRRQFGPLFEWTDRRGLQVFLDTDMLTLTPPLARRLRALAPDASTVGIDTADPLVWEVYRAGLEELFDRLPSIKGVIIRFGEGGSLYNTEGWPYRSEMAIRSAADLRAMLRGLLPLFEARGKTLVVRSWTVGVGQLGRLHVDPKIYETVLGDIDSPALVVSTKYTAGDFFSYLPLNPTLAAGRHQRLVEFQAKPEFEGFGAFPNFFGEEYARALRVLRSANPQIVGTFVMSQFGGPLRAGPRTLYPLHGFWLWTDANVFVASSLAVNPDADLNQLTRRWVEARFGGDPRIVDAVTQALTETRNAVLEGFYIRSFAERDVRVPGLDLPPLMWIFEWDMVGGWHSLLSLVYRGSRDNLDVAIAEGHAAAAVVRRARRKLQEAFAAAGPDSCTQICGETLRSLEYQETLFDALAAWRQTFLSYYRWLDTGDSLAWQSWRAGKQQFEIAAARHVARFGKDLEFPAFDLTSARRAVMAAERGGVARFFSVGLLIAVLALVAIGSPLAQRYDVLARRGRALARIGHVAWTTAMAPWRLGRAPIDVRSAVAVTSLGLVLVAFLVGTLTGFSSVWVAIGASLPLGVVALTFESTATRVAGHQRRGQYLVATVGPLLPGVVILLALIAYLGPVGVWLSFWNVPMLRVALLTVLLATLLWTPYVMVAARMVDGWQGTVGGSLAAAGAGLVALTALLPDWVDVLRFLDRPLNFAPATDTMVFALRTYAGVSLDIGHSSWILGTLLLAGGLALRRSPARSRKFASAGVTSHPE